MVSPIQCRRERASAYRQHKVGGSTGDRRSQRVGLMEPLDKAAEHHGVGRKHEPKEDQTKHRRDLQWRLSGCDRVCIR